MASSTSILYHDPAYNIILIDVPHSLSLAQGENLRIVSSKSLERPYPSTEPLKSLKQDDEPLETLLLEQHLRIALNELRAVHQGDFCLPRLVKSHQDDSSSTKISNKKRKLEQQKGGNITFPSFPPISMPTTLFDGSSPFILDHRGKPQSEVHIEHNSTTIHIPRDSYGVFGSIASTLPLFLNTPNPSTLDFIVLDPPWPNRSARRKGIYNTPRDLESVSDLLFSLPLSKKFSHGEVAVLAENGYVVVWITNKKSFKDMVIGEGGLFEHWGVQHLEEWAWLKVTRHGEPMSKIDGVWRKPYEIAVVGQKMTTSAHSQDSTPVVVRRVLVGVPDAHSRKPNLGEVLEAVHGRGTGKRVGLEIFARNMTAGAWGWGDQVLEYQDVECWEEREEEVEMQPGVETVEEGCGERVESGGNDT